VTRWNSSYLAWQRLLLLRDAISVLNTKLARETDGDSKKDSKQLKKIMITTQEWDLIQNLVDVLEPFAEATDYLGGSSYCTHSIINPLIEQIKKELKPPSQSSSSSRSTTSTTTAPDDEDVFNEEDLEFDQDQDDKLNQPTNTSGLLEIVKKKLYEKLCQYWNFQDPKSLLSTLLDPRTKSLKDVSVRIQLETEELLRDKVEELKLREITRDSPSSSPIFTSNSTSTTPKKYKKSIFAKFQKSKPKEINDEVLEYLNLDEIDWMENPFAWWAHNEKHFPYLSTLARKYLLVPAASTASERMFSDAGNIMGPKRTRMSPALFKRIIFLKRNSEMLPSIHPSTSK
jgi:hypothetical protein